MRANPMLIAICAMAIGISGCAREWKNPNTAIPSNKVKIATILINPIGYDSAGVIVEGKVWDLEVNAADYKKPYTTFKIADRDGNSINVYSPGIVPLFEGSIVRVWGIYRRQFKAENRSMSNEIEAKQIYEGSAKLSLN